MRRIILAIGEWLVRFGTPRSPVPDPADVADLMRIVERASRWADRDVARVPGELTPGVLHGGPLDGSPTGYVPDSTVELILPDYRTPNSEAVYVRTGRAFVYSHTDRPTAGAALDEFRAATRAGLEARERRRGDLDA